MLPKEIEGKQDKLMAQAKAILIVDKDSAEEAANLARELKDLKGEIQDAFRPIIKKAHEAHKEALAKEKSFLAPVEMARAYIKDGLKLYHAESAKDDLPSGVQFRAKENIEIDHDKFVDAIRKGTVPPYLVSVDMVRLRKELGAKGGELFEALYGDFATVTTDRTVVV